MGTLRRTFTPDHATISKEIDKEKSFFDENNAPHKKSI